MDDITDIEIPGSTFGEKKQFTCIDDQCQELTAMTVTDFIDHQKSEHQINITVHRQIFYSTVGKHYLSKLFDN